MLTARALPKTVVSPFGSSEIQGSASTTGTLPKWKNLMRFFGPGLLVSVGYMDPGNWATDIEAGSRYGYGLLSVVVFSSLAAVALQYLSLKLGIVTGKDLARHSRDHFGTRTNFSLWIFAELAIVACDLAEVLGSALAFHLLLGCTLLTGIALTAFDTMLILGLRAKGLRHIEAIVLGLILTIGACYAGELTLVQPEWRAVFRNLVPSKNMFSETHSWYLAIGILGATVMPHNLYLHSSIVQTRKIGPFRRDKTEAIRFSTIDTCISLFLALLVNAAILILAGTAFHMSGHDQVADIQDAYKLLSPVVGTGLASGLFAVALLASGQSSTFTGTLAGQILMEGHMKWKAPSWQRRLLTRGLALIPAFVGVLWLGENSIGRLLVLSQVCLSLQLPFATYPLIRFTSDRSLMGDFANQRWLAGLVWGLFFVISSANLWLIIQILR